MWQIIEMKYVHIGLKFTLFFLETFDIINCKTLQVNISKGVFFFFTGREKSVCVCHINVG